MLWKKENKQGGGWECWAGDGIAILNRVVRNSFIEKVTLLSDLKEVRKLAVWISGGKEFQKEGKAGAKIKSRNISGIVLETLRRAACWSRVSMQRSGGRWSEV